MSKHLLVKVVEATIDGVKELIAYNRRAAQGLLLTSFFLIATLRLFIGDGNWFELFCAWLSGYIYVRFISHVDPVDVHMEPTYIDFTRHGKTIDGLSAKIEFSDKTIETLYSVIWPAVMLYVGYKILVDLKRGASNGNDL